MEKRGIAGLGFRLSVKPQISNPNTLKAKKCASLSKPLMAPNIGKDGVDDSISSASEKQMIRKLKVKVSL